jgi:hypothetical protein
VKKRATLLAKCKQLAADMALTAKHIEISVEQADLGRLAWTVRAYDTVLAAQLDAAYENLHFVTGLASSKESE